MNESDKIKKNLKEYFSDKAEIDTVILFGSFAKNTFHQKSDVDIAIHSSKPLEYENLAKIQTELALILKREIDLADLSKADGLFLYQIMTTGEKIKISEKIFVDYLMKALCFKEDFLPVIEASRKAKIRRFING